MTASRAKHEHSFYLGQVHHNWQFQRLAPRTAREAFGCSLDTGHRRSDAWVLWVAAVLIVVGSLLARW